MKVNILPKDVTSSHKAENRTFGVIIIIIIILYSGICCAAKPRCFRATATKIYTKADLK